MTSLEMPKSLYDSMRVRKNARNEILRLIMQGAIGSFFTSSDKKGLLRVLEIHYP